MNIAILSIDYKTAPIEILEACSCNKDDITYYLSKLVTTVFFEEMVIISTCNRTEWVFLSLDSDKALDIMVKTISLKENVAPSIIKKHSKFIKNELALGHLFELTCGLKSMVLGENEILSQVKMNYLFCLEFGATSAILNKLFQTVIAIGKDVRTTTKISKGAHSISSIAIEAIKQNDQTYIKHPLLLIGAGVMVQRALAKLSSLGHQDLWIANRSISKAEELANNYNNLTVIPYALINENLYRFKTIYVGIHSRAFLFNKYHFEKLNKKIIVDLGIPRNVDPLCGELQNIKLISIDQLESVASKAIQFRKGDILNVKAIIQDAINDFYRWQEFRRKSQICTKNLAFG